MVHANFCKFHVDNSYWKPLIPTSLQTVHSSQVNITLNASQRQTQHTSKTAPGWYMEVQWLDSQLPTEEGPGSSPGWAIHPASCGLAWPKATNEQNQTILPSKMSFSPCCQWTLQTTNLFEWSHLWVPYLCPISLSVTSSVDSWSLKKVVKEKRFKSRCVRHQNERQSSKHCLCFTREK